jgi:hypothetical protein
MPIAALLLTAGAGLSLATPSHAQTVPFFIHSGDRVVMYGDEDTDARRYTNDVAAFILTRYPSIKVQWFDEGWGGDTVAGDTNWYGGGDIDTRLNRNVTPHHPTVVTIQLGYSDSQVDAEHPVTTFEQSDLDKFNAGYEHILDKVSKDNPGVRFTLITPDYHNNPDKEAILQHYVNSVAQIGNDNSVTVVDVSKPYGDMMAKAQTIDAAHAGGLIQNNNTPLEPGDALIAAEIVKAWGMGPTVSAVTIDASNGSVTQSANSSVVVKSSTGGLTWHQTDGSLPLPIHVEDPLNSILLQSTDAISSVDQETLQVANLSGSSYDLKIDGTDVGTFSASQLSAGINLATYNTPMLQQSLKVLKFEHESQDIKREADISLPIGNLNHSDSVNADVRKAISDLHIAANLAQSKAESAAKPLTRTFTLTLQ